MKTVSSINKDSGLAAVLIKTAAVMFLALLRISRVCLSTQSISAFDVSQMIAASLSAVTTPSLAELQMTRAITELDQTRVGRPLLKSKQANAGIRPHVILS